MKYLLWLGVLLTLLLGCSNTPELSQPFEAYGEARFKLPAGWREDRGGGVTYVSGGYGFMSGDYAGLTYLRLHQGAVFAVLGDWEITDNAATALAIAFADNISTPEPIKVLGYDGTYAHGTLEQGQGVGAVHVIYEKEGQPRQFVLIATVADEWKDFEKTFLEIIKTLELISK